MHPFRPARNPGAGPDSEELKGFRVALQMLPGVFNCLAWLASFPVTGEGRGPADRAGP